MLQKEVVITNSLGIHARPASMIVKTASKFRSTVTLVKDDMSADAKSIMSVMMLAAAQNSKIIIQVQGEDEQEAFTAISALFESHFNEN